MTGVSRNLPPFPLRRAGLVLLATGVGCMVLGAAGALAAGFADQSPIALATAGVCLVAAVAALVPVNRASRQGMQRVTMVMLFTFPLRVALVAIGVVVLAQALSWPVPALALWTLLWYLVFLCVEIGLVVQYLQSAAAESTKLTPNQAGG